MECPKCGEKLRDFDEFCSACGCDLKQVGSEVKTEAKFYSGDRENSFEYQSVPQWDANKRRTKKKDKKSIAVSALLTVTVIFVFGIVGLFVYRQVHKTPYEKKVYDLVALLNREVTTVDGCMKALFPQFICKDFEALMKTQCEEQGLDYEEQMIEANKSFNSQLEQTLEDKNMDYQYSYDVRKEKKLGDAELKDISESYTTASQILNVLTSTGETYKNDNKIKTYEAYMKLIEDFTTVEFTEGYELEVEFTALDESTDKEKEETMDVVVVKVDGEWMIDFVHYVDRFSNLFSQ